MQFNIISVVQSDDIDDDICHIMATNKKIHCLISPTDNP